MSELTEKVRDDFEDERECDCRHETYHRREEAVYAEAERLARVQP